MWKLRGRRQRKCYYGRVGSKFYLAEDAVLRVASSARDLSFLGTGND
jgi:hypothetical protein